MDPRQRMLKQMDNRFGNLSNTVRARVVTVAALDQVNLVATIAFSQGDPLDTPPDPMDVPWLDSYFPAVGDLAYLGTLEGAPILLGTVEREVWHDFALPTGYTVVAPYVTPGYRKDSQGRVFLRGAANVAASNAAGTKFVMPAGYRPLSGTVGLAAPFSNGTAISGHLRYDIGVSGNVVTLVASAAATTLMLFEGLSFDTRT